MSERVKILVIEEDAAVRRTVRTRLAAVPYPIEFADSVERAASLLGEPGPRVVILGTASRVTTRQSVDELLDRIRDRIALIPLADSPRHPVADSATDDPATGSATPPSGHAAKGPFELDDLEQAVAQALDELATRETGHGELARADSDVEDEDDVEDLAWIGGLAAMLAHELTSPLDGSLRYLGLLRRQLEQESDLIDYIEEIEHGLGRMARMIRALLAFSRNASTKRAPRSLQTLLEESEYQVRHYTPRPDIRVEVHGQGTPPQVSASLFQVFTNLMRNAFDAMSEGGCLAIHWTATDQDLDLLFEDDGPGFDEEERARAFEPFYTTKPFGRGTGLGLPICRRLVSALGGRIIIEAGAGRGARIRITVPLPPETTHCDGGERSE